MPDSITTEESQAVDGSFETLLPAGQYIRAGTHWVTGTYSIIEAEALALLEPMKEACTMNLEHVIFETDAQVVFKAIHANHAGTSYFSLLINRIENLLFLNSSEFGCS
jgi:hypothetical protein